MQIHRYASVKRSSKSHITSVAFSPDGSFVATGSDQVDLWDVANGEKRSRFKGHERHVTAVAFLPDGKTLVSADYYGFRFWKLDDNKQESETHLGGWIPCMAISPDGKLLAFGGAILHIRKMNLQHIWDHAFPGECWSISFSPMGKMLACTSDSTIEVCTVEPFTVDQELEGHEGRVWSVAYSPDGKTLASGSEDCSIKLWNVKNYSEINHFSEAHEHGVNCVCFSPDGYFLASGGNDGTAKIWDWKTGRNLATLSVGPSTGRARRSSTCVKNISFSPDGHTLVFGGSNASHLQFWNLEYDKE